MSEEIDIKEVIRKAQEDALKTVNAEVEFSRTKIQPITTESPERTVQRFRQPIQLESRKNEMEFAAALPKTITSGSADEGGGAGGDTIEIVVVDNGEFKTGTFYIDGELTAI